MASLSQTPLAPARNAQVDCDRMLLAQETRSLTMDVS
jgi:hypothetical protein